MNKPESAPLPPGLTRRGMLKATGVFGAVAALFPKEVFHALAGTNDIESDKITPTQAPDIAIGGEEFDINLFTGDGQIPVPVTNGEIWANPVTRELPGSLPENPQLGHNPVRLSRILTDINNWILSEWVLFKSTHDRTLEVTNNEISPNMDNGGLPTIFARLVLALSGDESIRINDEERHFWEKVTSEKAMDGMNGKVENELSIINDTIPEVRRYSASMRNTLSPEPGFIENNMHAVSNIVEPLDLTNTNSPSSVFWEAIAQHPDNSKILEALAIIDIDEEARIALSSDIGSDSYVLIPNLNYVLVDMLNDLVGTDTLTAEQEEIIRTLHAELIPRTYPSEEISTQLQQILTLEGERGERERVRLFRGQNGATSVALYHLLHEVVDKICEWDRQNHNIQGNPIIPEEDVYEPIQILRSRPIPAPGESPQSFSPLVSFGDIFLPGWFSAGDFRLHEPMGEQRDRENELVEQTILATLYLSFSALFEQPRTISETDLESIRPGIRLLSSTLVMGPWFPDNDDQQNLNNRNCYVLQRELGLSPDIEKDNIQYTSAAIILSRLRESAKRTLASHEFDPYQLQFGPGNLAYNTILDFVNSLIYGESLENHPLANSGEYLQTCLKILTEKYRKLDVIKRISINSDGTTAMGYDGTYYLDVNNIRASTLGATTIHEFFHNYDRERFLTRINEGDSVEGVVRPLLILNSIINSAFGEEGDLDDTQKAEALINCIGFDVNDTKKTQDTIRETAEQLGVFDNFFAGISDTIENNKYNDLQKQSILKAAIYMKKLSIEGSVRLSEETTVILEELLSSYNFGLKHAYEGVMQVYLDYEELSPNLSNNPAAITIAPSDIYRLRNGNIGGLSIKEKISLAEYYITEMHLKDYFDSLDVQDLEYLISPAHSLDAKITKLQEILTNGQLFNSLSMDIFAMEFATLGLYGSENRNTRENLSKDEALLAKILIEIKRMHEYGSIERTANVRQEYINAFAIALQRTGMSSMNIVTTALKTIRNFINKIGNVEMLEIVNQFEEDFRAIAPN